jgi:hypothetical protein
MRPLDPETLPCKLDAQNLILAGSSGARPMGIWKKKEKEKEKEKAT